MPLPPDDTIPSSGAPGSDNASSNSGASGGNGGPGGAPGPGGLPGIEGKDYRLVRGPNGQVYAVYAMKIGNQTIQVSWRIEPKHYDAFGIRDGRLSTMSRTQFAKMQMLGNSTELQLSGDGRHPFNVFIKGLREQFGNVSWLQDPEYLGTLLEGWAEGKDAQTIQNELTQTKWYQSHTEAQRQWTGLGKADRQAAVQAMTLRVQDALIELYGPDMPYQKQGFGAAELAKMAKKIATGAYGDPGGAGFQVWFSQMRAEAEKVEGSAAWISREQTLYEQRDFMNAPENKYEELRQDAIRWLGPQSKNMPFLSRDTLKQWADDIVTGKRSDADWAAFLRKQAKSMYPYLGTDQTWMEFADPYKAKLEQLWGRPVDWSNSMLADLTGAASPTGDSAGGKSLSFDEWERKIRHTDQFWGGRTARDEGFDLIGQLESIFLGVNN